MIETVLGIISIVAAIVFFLLGRQYGTQQNKQVINELKEQKKQNNKLTEKVDQLTHQNENLIGNMKELKNHNDEQKEMLEKSYKAIGVLNQQNEELTRKIGYLESRVSNQKSIATTTKQDFDLNKLLYALSTSSITTSMSKDRE